MLVVALPTAGSPTAVVPAGLHQPAPRPVMPLELGLNGVPQPPAPTLMGLGTGTGLAIGGSTSVQRLQQSLAQLAVTVNRPAINPGAADGIVNAQLMMAILQAFNILAEKLPAEARYPLQLAILAGSFFSTATDLVKKYADVLNAAAQAAIMKYTQAPNAPLPPNTGATPGGGTTPATTTPPPLAPTPWFKQPTGIIAIVAGVVGGVGLIYAIVK